jgi:hypothetical protein
VLAVNLTGAFNLVSALLPPLRETSGDVVLIGSVSGSWTDCSGAACQNRPEPPDAEMRVRMLHAIGRTS